MRFVALYRLRADCDIYTTFIRHVSNRAGKVAKLTFSEWEMDDVESLINVHTQCSMIVSMIRACKVVRFEDVC